MNYPLQVYVLNSFLEKDKKWADSLSAAESSSNNELTSLLCNTFLPSSTRVQNSISDVRIALLFTGWNVRLQFFSANKPSLMCDRVDQLVMLFSFFFFSYICKGCNLFSLLLSSFHFCSHVFPFLTVSPFKHTSNKPGEGLECLKVHPLLLMVSLSQEDITFSFTNLA